MPAAWRRGRLRARGLRANLRTIAKIMDFRGFYLEFAGLEHDVELSLFKSRPLNFISKAPKGNGIGATSSENPRAY